MGSIPWAARPTIEPATVVDDDHGAFRSTRCVQFGRAKMTPFRRAFSIAVGAVAFEIVDVAPYVWPGLLQGPMHLLHVVARPVMAIVLIVLAVNGTRKALRSNAGIGDGTPWISIAAPFLVLSGSLMLAIGIRRLVFLDLPPGSDQLAFDREAWLAAGALKSDSDGVSRRQKMLADVVSQVLRNRTRTDVERDLGASLDTPYFRESGRDAIYALGPGRSAFSLDSEWLLVWFDKDGRVTRHVVVED